MMNHPLKMFDAQTCIGRLERNAQVFVALIDGVSDEQARWKPSPDRWSILEVVSHLRDEEREDFRVRLDLILNHPKKPWPPIDPQAWVMERAYNTHNLREMLTRLIEERARSIAWLRGLRSPDWETLATHGLRSMRASAMLSSWVAHDWLHVRQLSKLHYEYNVLQARPESVAYAGEY